MNLKMTKRALFAAAFALACAGGLASTAVANHKSNVPDYDFAVRGTNYPGWPSEGACAADRPGQGCRLVISSCEQYAHPIYSTQRILSALLTAANEGQDIPVHLVSSTGHFINLLCTIRR